MAAGTRFPFRGMPEWAQWLGRILPVTHMLRVVRGAMLKGAGIEEALPSLSPGAVCGDRRGVGGATVYNDARLSHRAQAAG